jgi:pimeloyl-ACP methyl ester carboxylesterase
MMHIFLLFLFALLSVTPHTISPLFEPAPCPRTMPSNVDCGYLTVPEDRTNPSSATIRVAVAIFRTSAREPAPDPLLFLDGGPGSRTLDAWSAGLDRLIVRVGNDRDIIIFDQRGMGYSEPALTCPEQSEHHSDDWLRHCHDRLVQSGVSLAAYTTRENARDAADLMKTLGYTSYNVWGGSYGSSLALALLRDHPEGIRSVILTALQPTQVSLQELLAPMFQRSFDLVAEQCAADATCSAAFPGDMRAKLDTIITHLDEAPFQVDVDGQIQSLTGSVLIDGLSEILKYSDYLPGIPALIDALYSEDYSVVLPYAQALSVPVSPNNPIGAVWSIRCTDSALAVTPEQFEARLENVDPVFREHFRRKYQSDLSTCQMWGSHIPTDAELAPAVSDVPVLILNGEFDPFSSPENVNVTLATLSNGHAFWFPGYGHGVNIDVCAQRIFHDFVTNPDQTPDSTCISDIPHLRFQVP